MQNLIGISIVVGDRNYRLKVPPQEEESVRKTLKTINDKIIEFKTNFAGKDMQDYIAMVLVWYASQGAEGGLNSNSIPKIESQLDDIEHLVDKSLLQ